MAGGPSYFERLSSIRYLLYRIWYLSYPFIAWSALYFGYKFWEEWHEQRLRFEQEKTLSHQAQLAMLRYQLNPHFLFNTFSSLRALIYVDVQKAEAMITKMSEFLRYSLLEGNNNEVPLSREIEIIKLYLEIESIRFKENLSVEFKIDPKSENYPIPVFLIHPLIENAIKYGMKTSPMPLNVFVTANMIDDQLQIEVKNTGNWIEGQAHPGRIQKGIGLDNVRKRIEHSYPNNHTLEIIKDDGTVIVRMRLKKES
jgi:LytS/YehU family sensor histidine kinase